MSELLLQAQDLTRHYAVRRGLFQPPATVKALNGVSFSLAPRKTLAVVGESGCGKSTLARQLTLSEPPTRGTLQIRGVATAGAEVKALRREVQMVFQN
ncbi:ATP-binding cassette domain-containing protein, partial [Chromohalobacter sp. HP20-39]|uniref:ATP-binding cassette domain-containing protein n=1 Tax=Chromohalobacter sp. HP20-39 TaxID=3079306 RepID=UPI00294B55BA